jgi:hypothetical protein
MCKKKVLLSAANRVFVLDSVSHLHGVTYFSSSITGNYVMSVLEATSFKLRSICMNVNLK